MIEMPNLNRHFLWTVQLNIFSEIFPGKPPNFHQRAIYASDITPLTFHCQTIHPDID